MTSVADVKLTPPIPEEEYLTEDEIDEYLDSLKTKLPSFIIELLRNNLKDKKVTKKQLDKIVDRIVDIYLGKKSTEDKKTEELAKKINELSQKLDALMKIATMATTAKISEDIERISRESLEVEKEEEKFKEEEKEKEKLEEAPKVEEKVEVTEEEKVSELDEEPKIEEKEGPPKADVPIQVEAVKEEPKSEEGVISVPSVIQPAEEKYRLEELPDDTLSTMLVFKWLEFLINRVGLSNLPDVLEYYHDLKWISGKVISKLMKVAKNMKYFHDDPEWRPMDKLTPEDHIVSLLYVEKLAGRPIPAEEIENIEREIKRIRKWAEEIQNI